MLKGIDPSLLAELPHVLMSMGHGDELVICDVNHPAAAIARHTAHCKLIDMPGCDIARATAAIRECWSKADAGTRNPLVINRLAWFAALN